MTLQDQIDALVRQQGARPDEDDLLTADVAVYEPVDDSGINSTYRVVLETETVAFHKPFAGVATSTALMYGHEPDQVPLNECAAWRLAAALGAPFSELVAVCVLRACEGEAGSLSRYVPGEEALKEAFSDAPEQCAAAAFFDALAAQQDRHHGNARWDSDTGRLGLIDHGFCFALPGDYPNAAEFVAWRWQESRQALTDPEVEALRRLLDSSDLLGLAGVLLSERAQALRERAESMHQRRTILRPGEF